MISISESFKSFENEDSVAYQKLFGEQIQKHFQFLVSHVPNIKIIEWKTESIDEDMYAVTAFKLIKNNDYTFISEIYGDHQFISIEEFTQKEIDTIDLFIDYLHRSSRLSYLIMGHETLFLSNE